MKNTIRLFLCSLVCSFNLLAVRSPVPQVTTPPAIMQIATQNMQWGSLIVTLSNGTTWKVADKALFAPAGWKLGDRVRIVYIHSGGYFLENVSYPGCIGADLTNASSKTIRANIIQTISTGGSKEEPTHTILLDDGTTWHVGSWSSGWMKDWKAGDRVLLSPGDFLAGRATHWMINLDRKLMTADLWGSPPANVRARLLANPHALSAPTDANLRPGRTWKHTITSIKRTGSGYTVELDSQTLWECPEQAKGWKAGDEITFTDSISLYNRTKHSEVKAKILNAPAASLISTLSIATVSEKLVLSDGSVWFLAQTKNGWKLGDRIMVGKDPHMGYDMSNHLLINLSHSQKESPDFSPATLVR